MRWNSSVRAQLRACLRAFARKSGRSRASRNLSFWLLMAGWRRAGWWSPAGWQGERLSQSRAAEPGSCLDVSLRSEPDAALAPSWGALPARSRLELGAVLAPRWGARAGV